MYEDTTEADEKRIVEAGMMAAKTMKNKVNIDETDVLTYL
jgi:hypothetical protein